jgi:hypothetical protein
MSIAISSEVWAKSQVRGATRLVLLCLADHADDRGVAWPGISTIHRKTLISRRQVSRCIAELVAAEEIEILRQGSGHGHSSVYRILLADKEDATPPLARRGKESKRATKDDTMSERVTFETEKGDTMPERMTFEAEKGDTMSERMTFEAEKGDKVSSKSVRDPSSDPSVDPSTDPSGKRQRGKRTKQPRRRKPERKEQFVLPEVLQTQAFRESWAAYEQHRREIKKPLTQTAGDRALKRLAKAGEQEAIARIERSIGNGWQGLFFPGDAVRYRYLQASEGKERPSRRPDDAIERLKSRLEKSQDE